MTAMLSVSRTFLVAVSQLTDDRLPSFSGQIYQAIQGRAGNRCQRPCGLFRTPTSPSYLPWYDINITNSCCLYLCYVPTKITYDIGTFEIRREQLECTGSLTLWTRATFFDYILAKLTSNLHFCTHFLIPIESML